MATQLLGATIDIHCGGSDLAFPHHECEIAQSETATGHRPFANFWLHVAMVGYEGEKMSKSLGNLVMVRELLEDYSPDAVRLYLAQHHYRQPWEYRATKLEQAAALVQKLQIALKQFGGHGEALDAAPWQQRFIDALADDLNTPQALEILASLAAAIMNAAQQAQVVNPAQDTLQAMGLVLGLRLDAEATGSNVMAGWNRHLQHFET